MTHRRRPDWYIHSMPVQLRDWRFLLVATAVMSVIVTSPSTSSAADEVNDRTAAAVKPAVFSGQRPAVRARAPEMVIGHLVRDPAWLDSAIRTLLCLEAREAIRTGRLGREVLDWIMSSAQTCPDERLLFDTFGF